MRQGAVYVATPVGGLCFLQKHMKSGHKNLCLTEQGVMDIVPDQPFTAFVRNFGH